jgi:hypothetical protein
VYSNTVTGASIVGCRDGSDHEWAVAGAGASLIDPLSGSGQREVSVVVALHCRFCLWLCQAIQYDNVLDSVRDNAQFFVHLDENGEVECISVVCCFVAKCKLSKVHQNPLCKKISKKVYFQISKKYIVS